MDTTASCVAMGDMKEASDLADCQEVTDLLDVSYKAEDSRKVRKRETFSCKEDLMEVRGQASCRVEDSAAVTDKVEISYMVAGLPAGTDREK